MYFSELKIREKQLVASALQAQRYNQTYAAAVLGISRRTLAYKIKELGFRARSEIANWIDPVLVEKLTPMNTERLEKIRARDRAYQLKSKAEKRHE